MEVERACLFYGQGVLCGGLTSSAKDVNAAVLGGPLPIYTLVQKTRSTNLCGSYLYLWNRCIYVVWKLMLVLCCGDVNNMWNGIQFVDFTLFLVIHFMYICMPFLVLEVIIMECQVCLGFASFLMYKSSY